MASLQKSNVNTKNDFSIIPEDIINKMINSDKIYVLYKKHVNDLYVPFQPELDICMFFKGELYYPNTIIYESVLRRYPNGNIDLDISVFGHKAQIITKTEHLYLEHEFFDEDKGIALAIFSIDNTQMLNTDLRNLLSENTEN